MGKADRSLFARINDIQEYIEPMFRAADEACGHFSRLHQQEPEGSENREEYARQYRQALKERIMLGRVSDALESVLEEAKRADKAIEHIKSRNLV